MRSFYLCQRALLAGLLAASLCRVCRAQEVRRAIPIDQDLPTERAVPVEPFETPTPAPVSTPASNSSPPPVSDVKAPEPAPPAPAANESPDQTQLDYANGFYARGFFDSAAPEYEKYLSLYPNAPMLDRESALFRLGECYRRIGNVNAAKNQYESLLQQYEIGQFIGPAAYRLADMAYADKDYDSALNYYRKASVRLADPLVALAARFYSARCLEAEKLPSEARITYEDIIDTKGDNPYREPSRLALAEILANYGRNDDALAQFDALAKEAEQPAVKAEALVKAGLLYIDLSQPDKAAADLNKALAIPEVGEWKPIAQIGLLRVLFATGRYKEVATQYQDAFSTVPPENQPEVLILAADSKRKMNDFAGAGDLYQQVIHDFPASPYADEARYDNLVSLYNTNDPALIAAVDDFLAGKPEATRRDQAMLLKAESLFKAKQYADAAPIYAALEDSTLNSDYKAEVFFKLGWCYMQTHQPDLAIAALSDFLKNYPFNKLVPSALAQRAIAYQQTKDLASALKDFNQLLNQYPRARERELALQQKALILGEQQDDAGMSAAFKELLEEFPHTPVAAQANYFIGSAAFSAKDYRACIQPLENARKLDKAEYFERATVRIIGAYYTLGERDSLAAEVDLYNNSHPKDKVQAEVLRSLGSSYLTARDYANAGKYLKQLTPRDEATPDDWLNLGRAQLGAAQYQDAIKSINKYLDSQNDPALKVNGLLALGSAQLQAAQLDDAQASADKICTLEPEGPLNAQGRMLSGDIQVARGDYDSAAKIYQGIAVIIDDPDISPTALEKAYNCLNRQGKSAEASKLLNELQSKYPEYQIGHLADQTGHAPQ